MYDLWLSWALCGIIEQPYVKGLESNALPDGGEGVGLAFSGPRDEPDLVRRRHLRVRSSASC